MIADSKKYLCKISFVACLALIGCAGKNIQADSATNGATSDAGVSAEDSVVTSSPSGSEYLLICKAKKSRFHFDWTAAKAGNEQIDQNSVRYKFRAATKPAGDKGENLKVGECGWAGRALANTKKESQFLMKSLSEEATLAFYKMRTGKVFQLPVRKSKTGMVVLPKSEVKVIR